MYKISTPTILFVLLCFCFACKKSSNDVNQASITGKWTLQKFTSAQYYNGVLQTTPPNAPVTASIEFRSNGVFIDAYSSGGTIDTTSGQYSLSGKMITFSNSNSRGNGPGAPTPTPLSLFFGGSMDNASITSQISQLSRDEMVVHAEIVNTISSTNVYKEVLDEYYIR